MLVIDIRLNVRKYTSDQCRIMFRVFRRNLEAVVKLVQD